MMSALKELVEYMETVPDPRKYQGIRFRFSTPLSILVLASLLGLGSFLQITKMIKTLPQRTLQELGCIRRRIYFPPENSTYRRAMLAVDMDRFLAATAKWLEEQGKNQIVPEVSGRLQALSKRQRAGEVK